MGRDPDAAAATKLGTGELWTVDIAGTREEDLEPM